MREDTLTDIREDIPDIAMQVNISSARLRGSWSHSEVDRNDIPDIPHHIPALFPHTHREGI